MTIPYDFDLTQDPAQVGHWFLPLALGIPAGAFGGYQYRKWRETHPGKLIPWISGDDVDPRIAPHLDSRAARHLIPLRRAASDAVWHKMEADGDQAAPLYLYVARDGRAHVTGHRSPEELWSYAMGFEALPGFRYAASFRVSDGQIALEAEATAEHPAHASAVGAWPWASIQDPGGPWFAQRGPWIDIIGSDGGASRHQGKLLIHAAIQDVIAEPHPPWAGAYAWYLDPSGTSHVVPHVSFMEAIEAVRAAHQGAPYVAIAVFDERSSHWPHPVAWHMDHDPAYAGAIAAKITPPTAPSVGAWQSIVGGGPWSSIVGGGPWYAIVSGALDVLRRQAKIAADGVAARVVGVVRTAGDRWHLRQFRSADAADDWFGRVTRDPATFTYAAYFDKADVLYPDPLNEQIGGARARALPERGA